MIRPSLGTLRLALLLSTLLVPCLGAGTITAQNQWTRVGGLPRHYGHRMAYDRGRGVTVLFGGDLNNRLLGDTREWDGHAWALRQTESQPSPRRDHSLAYVVDEAAVMLWGGFVGGGRYAADLWKWDGERWTLLPTANAPLARGEHGMVYDEARGRLVLFGGRGTQGLFMNDHWEWDGTDWIQLFPNPRPSPRSLVAMAYDRARERVVLFGGLICDDETWEWNGERWERVATGGPSPRFVSHMAYDADRQRVVLFGGSCLQTENFEDTWEWDGVRWSERSPLGGIPGRGWGDMAYDEQRRRMVVTNGLSCDRFFCTPLGDTWEYRVTNEATLTSYGSSCGGSGGTPQLVRRPYAWPWVGDTFPLDVTSPLEETTALGVVGLSNTSWGPRALPFELYPVGAPGCQIWTSALRTFALEVTQGAARWDLTVPPDGTLVGRPFYAQALVLDPAANPAGITLTNGIAGRVGMR